MAESEFPKTDGDVYYAYDVNKAGYQQYETFEQETLSVTTSSASVSYAAERDTHLIKNVGSVTCYVNFDATATTDSYVLDPGSTLPIDTNATAIHAITASSTTTLRIIGMS